MTASATGFVHAVVPVLHNPAIARDTHRLRFRFPALAARIRPGQFLMIRLPGRTDPLLGRAFALYDTIDADGEPDSVEVVYLVVGKMTGLMSHLQVGDEVEVWGPLGNGFPDYADLNQLVLVAGGIGQTPFLSLSRRVLGQRGYGGPPRREVQHVSLYYGVRSADLFAGLADFEQAGATVSLASDDGSRGFHGFVTQLLAGQGSVVTGPGTRWVGCGPEPMMHALAELAARSGVGCDLSLETPMA
ncbi:MAG: dihydroorotate dehydrogenase electron transfer subunit, partial [Gemmataceae bacterium]|nr:dihydroorotate dehydrogenase electron transfer subunit [Gemmataceae bacterium]